MFLQNFHRAKCSGLWVIVVAEKKTPTKTILSAVVNVRIVKTIIIDLGGPFGPMGLVRTCTMLWSTKNLHYRVGYSDMSNGFVHTIFTLGPIPVIIISSLSLTVYQLI